MISPDSPGGPNIAVITLICGWTFLAIALVLVAFVLWFRIRSRSLRFDDCLTSLALVMSIALIAQTTWAIVDEGQDGHEVDLSNRNFALLVRVGQSAQALCCIY